METKPSFSLKAFVSPSQSPPIFLPSLNLFPTSSRPPLFPIKILGHLIPLLGLSNRDQAAQMCGWFFASSQIHLISGFSHQLQEMLRAFVSSQGVGLDVEDWIEK